MDIPTIADLQRVEEKVDYLIQAMDLLQEKKVRLLTSHEIAMGLNVSYRTFINMRPELVKHGVKKSWRQLGNEGNISSEVYRPAQLNLRTQVDVNLGRGELSNTHGLHHIEDRSSLVGIQGTESMPSQMDGQHSFNTGFTL